VAGKLFRKIISVKTPQRDTKIKISQLRKVARKKEHAGFESCLETSYSTTPGGGKRHSQGDLFLLHWDAAGQAKKKQPTRGESTPRSPGTLCLKQHAVKKNTCPCPSKNARYVK